MTDATQCKVLRYVVNQPLDSKVTYVAGPCFTLFCFIFSLTTSAAESADWSSAKTLLLSLLGHGNNQVMGIAHSYFVVRIIMNIAMIKD